MAALTSLVMNTRSAERAQMAPAVLAAVRKPATSTSIPIVTSVDLYAGQMALHILPSALFECERATRGSALWSPMKATVVSFVSGEKSLKPNRFLFLGEMFVTLIHELWVFGLPFYSHNQNNFMFL